MQIAKQAFIILFNVALVRIAIPADLKDNAHDSADDKEDKAPPTGLLEGLRLICTRKCVLCAWKTYITYSNGRPESYLHPKVCIVCMENVYHILNWKD